MNIIYIKQDVTSIKRGIIGHGCNCVGVMGAGVAATIRRKWPKVYNDYTRMCRAHSDNPDSLLGGCQLINIGTSPFEQLYVANLFTQIACGRAGIYARPHAIKESIGGLMQYAINKDLRIYIPRIGAGLGGLDWDTDVVPVLKEVINEFNTDITVCDLPFSVVK